MECPRAYALGVPNRGIHATRMGGTALWDWVFTIIISLMIAGIAGVCGAWTKDTAASWWGWFAVVSALVFVGLVVLGETLHFVWGVDTAVLKAIGLARYCAPEPPPDTPQG